MKKSTFLLLLLFFFGCTKSNVSTINEKIAYKTYNFQSSDQILPFKLLNELNKENKSNKVKNLEVYSEGLPGTYPFFFNWNLENSLLYVAAGPWECKSSGLSGIYLGLDSNSILKFENLSLKELGISLNKILKEANRGNLNEDILIKSLNSTTCDLFNKKY